ncbi:hypothetical protein [Nonomuraea sp. NEAU-A123]|uniref:hypothetical protein n=1 Tax=Nonomuraea sp. NEAU-A123 TaxID=2839649 RepID=UPI001BE488D9|nr:hypothetical protein [Nonomuraea sp. NEAU-A123]MBT2227216.1 hypothetical protein [Nonomuraea sp. NEAU-A123]
MSDLEARLRAALEARAQTFPARPNAWVEVQRRTPPPVPRGRWLLAALPIALLAVFVPFLLNGGLGRNSANDPDGVYTQLMEGKTAAGEQVLVDDPAQGKPLRLWFARDRAGAPLVCYVAQPADSAAFGSCHDLRMAEIMERSGTYEGSTRTDAPSAYVDYGLTQTDVTKVTAVLTDGRRVEATLHRSEGAPMVIWTLALSARDRVSKVEFTDAKGRQGSDTSPNYLIHESRRGTPIGQAMRLPGEVTVRPYDFKVLGRRIFWFRQGKELGWINLDTKDPTPDPVPAIFSDEGLIYTATGRDTAKIVLTTGSDAPITVEGVPDPWGLDRNLFTVARLARLDWTAGGWVAGYDAAGKQLWRKDYPRRMRQPKSAFKPTGEPIPVPGTDDFSNGPVQLLFGTYPYKGVENDLQLCASGGTAYEGVPQLNCSSVKPQAPFGSFSRNEVKTYLPLPGSVVSFGTAEDDWLSVDAVLEDGRRLPATLIRGKDLPAPVWWVKYPLDAKIGAFTYKVRGKQLEQIRLSRQWCWGDKKPLDAGHVFDGGLTADLHDGSCVKWWKDGKEQPGSFQPAPGGKLSDLVAAPERPLNWSSHLGQWYGFTLPGTAKVDVTLKGGRHATASTVPDPWGQGVVLFAGTVPKADTKQGLFWPGMRFTGYAADGRVLWTYEPKELDD